MARGTVTIKSGPVSATVNQRSLLKSYDSVTKGAASGFVERAEAGLTPIMASARLRWPVKSGRSRDEIKLRTRFASSTIRVGLHNRATYIYYIRFSKRTRAELDAEASQVGAAIAAGRSLPGHEDDTKWGAITLSRRFRRSPTDKEATAWHRARLTWRHGHGAPTKELAGKHAWSTLVGKPFKTDSRTIAKDLQGDMDVLTRKL